MRRNAIDAMLADDEQQDADAELLDAVLKFGVADDIEPDLLSCATFDAFSDMRNRIRYGQRLTPKQRAWVQSVADNAGIVLPRNANLVSRGLVPRAREVDVALVLRRDQLPMKPPGRK